MEEEKKATTFVGVKDFLMMSIEFKEWQENLNHSDKKKLLNKIVKHMDDIDNPLIIDLDLGKKLLYG